MKDLCLVGGIFPSDAGTISSLDLVKQINIFREQEGNRSELQHSDLLKVIRDEFSDEIGLGKISETPYVHPQNGQRYPMFVLSLSEAKQVLVRESKFVRKAVIAYISELESSLSSRIPRTFSEALQLAANQAKELEEKNALLLEQQPKLAFFDAVADSKDAISIGDLSKILGIKGYGRNNLFDFLRKKRILMENNVPYQRYQDMGLFRVIEQKFMKNGEPCINIKTLVYQKGVDYVRNLIERKS